MPVGTDVDLGPGHTVLDGDPSLPQKGAQQPAPLFGPCLLWPNGRPSQLLLSTCYFCKLYFILTTQYDIMSRERELDVPETLYHIVR